MALCLTQPMVKLLPQEQHLDRQPSTVVTQATTWWETVLACVKLQGIGLGMHLRVNLRTVAVWLTQLMAKLVTLLAQHSDRQPPTVVTQATTWWETVLAHVKLQKSGLGVHLPVKVCFISTQGHLRTGFMAFEAILFKSTLWLVKKLDVIVYCCYV